MLNVLDKEEFNELMKQTVRPKATPRIVLRQTNRTGNIVHSFYDYDIADFTFKRGVDPIGRSLPFMELTWKETYTGKLSSDNINIKYNNVFPLMPVNLYIDQNLTFDASQTVRLVFPTLYLVDKPIVQGNQIVWTARDMMYFLNNKQEIGFRSGINFRNPLRLFLLDERATYKNNEKFIEALDLTQKSIINQNEKVIDTDTIYDGTTKNLLKDIACTRSYFWDFDGESMSLNSLSGLLNQTTPVFAFSGDIMKKYPDITKSSNISGFSFQRHKVKVKTNEEYTRELPDIVEEEMGISFYRYDLDSWGVVTSIKGGTLPPNVITKTIYTVDATENITVAPAITITEELFVNNNKDGELYSENNSCFYREENSKMSPRMELLDKYFNENVRIMVFEGLPHFAIEPCDLVEVETNLFEGDERITKKGVVVEQELIYNGAWLQKNIVHGFSK